MSLREEELLARLRATFKGEAADHLQTIAVGLLELEKTSPQAEQQQQIAKVFRAAHSLKGAARAVNISEIESICQSLEDVFAAWRRGESVPSPAGFDALHRSLDAIDSAITVPEKPAASGRAPKFPTTEALQSDGSVPPGAPDVSAVPETIRISVAALDAQLLEAEELLIAKLAAGQCAADLRGLGEWFDAWTKEWVCVQPAARAMRQSVERAGNLPASSDLARLLDFCDWSFDRVKALEGRISALAFRARHDQHVVGKLVDDLLEDAKRLMLLPFGTLAAPLPRLVRDLCREQGKEARLDVRGEETTLDKRIIEEMKDPLIHLLRNCVDHGIEPPARRAALGKPPAATITIALSPVNGDKVELLVEDDGAGIDVERVRESAVRRGLITAEEAGALDDAAALALVFRPEVSTSPIITRVSGRGLGLAIARENTEKLGGTITVDTWRGRGTVFHMVLPATLATARGVTIDAGGRTFVVPSRHVERVARVQRDNIQTVEGRETIALNGQTITLARLTDTLELPVGDGDDAAPASMVPVVVLGAGEDRVAFAVDAVLGEQEVLVKSIAKPLSRVRNIAGATVLGTGQVVPILNVPDLIKSARRHGRPAARAKSGSVETSAAAKSVLVVEDSITSRMLLKGILESAGYEVKTAVDGMDALTYLRTESFELVVSDVEMPRMNGFDLTRTIRVDRKLADLPVVLVTALETREDRERGIDAGANAYLVKSSFEQGSLLDTVRRFI
ncbi:MAG TPA: response regulator [Opitutaceae bacterium]